MSFIHFRQRGNKLDDKSWGRPLALTFFSLFHFYMFNDFQKPNRSWYFTCPHNIWDPPQSSKKSRLLVLVFGFLQTAKDICLVSCLVSKKLSLADWHTVELSRCCDGLSRTDDDIQKVFMCNGFEQRSAMWKGHFSFVHRNWNALIEGTDPQYTIRTLPARGESCCISHEHAS